MDTRNNEFEDDFCSFVLFSHELYVLYTFVQVFVQALRETSHKTMDMIQLVEPLTFGEGLPLKGQGPSMEWLVKGSSMRSKGGDFSLCKAGGKVNYTLED